MNARPALAALVVLAGVITLGGVQFNLFTPTPANQTMGNMRDAGIGEGQKFVQICNERLERQSVRRANRLQPGVLRPLQQYARVARLSVCLRVDGGTSNCFRVADGGVLVEADFAADIVVPSLRVDLDGGVLEDDGGVGDGGDSNVIDDARPVTCQHVSCAQYDDMVDAGLAANPYADRFCAALNRMAILPLPNMIPDCRVLSADGGTTWDGELGKPGHPPAVDCKFAGPWALPDGGPRWAGCNSLPREYAVGTQCLPVADGTQVGDLLEQEWL